MSWFDLDLSALQEQISKSVAEAGKVLEEVSKHDILNLDALAEREEEDEKYEELIKGMDIRDIESLLAQEQAQRQSLQSSLFNENDEDIIEKQRMSPVDVIEEENDWEDFEYPVSKTEKRSNVSHSHSADQYHQESLSDERSNESMKPANNLHIENVDEDNNEVGDIEVSDNEDISEKSIIINQSISHVVSDGNVEENIQPQVVVQLSTEADPPAHDLELNDIVEGRSENALAKVATKNNNKYNKTKLMDKICDKNLPKSKVVKASQALPLPKSNNNFVKPDLSNQVLSQYKISEQSVSIGNTAIPADVLARILKKREKKMKRKGLILTSQEEQEPKASSSSSGMVTMTMLMSDTLGFGIDDAVPTIDDATRNNALGVANADESNYSPLQETSQGSIISGLVFPISFSAMSSTSTAASTLASNLISNAYSSIFDDVVDSGAAETEGVYVDPILRQVEQNKRMSNIRPTPVANVTARDNSDQLRESNLAPEIGRSFTFSAVSSVVTSYTSRILSSVESVYQSNPILPVHRPPNSDVSLGSVQASNEGLSTQLSNLFPRIVSALESVSWFVRSLLWMAWKTLELSFVVLRWLLSLIL